MTLFSTVVYLVFTLLRFEKGACYGTLHSFLFINHLGSSVVCTVSWDQAEKSSGLDSGKMLRERSLLLLALCSLSRES